MNKSIAIICEYVLIPERIGGMDYFFVAYDKALKEKGYQPIWFFKEAQHFDFYTTLTIHNANNKDVESYFLNYCFSKKIKFDVIITHFTALCTSFYKKVKYCTAAYIIAVDHNPRPIGGFPIKKKVFNKIKGKLYHKYIDQFIAVSNYSKKNLIKDFGKQITSKIKVIFNGIETEKYVLKKHFDSHKNFIVACHLREEKGVQDIIKAVSYLPVVMQNKLTLTIYGEGPFEETLKLNVIKNNLQKNIFFKGSTDKIHEIYQHYDYLIHASHGETFCFTIVESLMANLPVITTKEAGNILGLVKENYNGYTFNVQQPKQLTNILEAIISDKKQIVLSNFNKSIENKFSINNMVNNHLKLLECI